ncbi:molybdopterin-dependent oxidoreductase [Saccharococcus thermophilus]|uniref:molybdopterin-dependent oxidoreductase n=1 Tax=Saccharococcus thermophilus TaxID=29396 RepID=UPI00141E045B
MIFIGADVGTRNDMDGLFHYARSLPLHKAMHPDTIIAYEYNDSLLCGTAKDMGIMRSKRCT